MNQDAFLYGMVFGVLLVLLCLSLARAWDQRKYGAQTLRDLLDGLDIAKIAPMPTCKPPRVVTPCTISPELEEQIRVDWERIFIAPSMMGSGYQPAEPVKFRNRPTYRPPAPPPSDQ